MDINELKKIIEVDKASEDKKNMTVADNYYRVKNDILKRKITYKLEGREVEDKTKSNNKIAHAFFKILIDQKINYLLGKPMKIATEMDEEEIELIHEIIQQWAKGASIKGIEWLHVYRNKNKEFDFTIVPAQQIIPFYSADGKELEQIIRYYSYKNIEHVEVWDTENVNYYYKEDNDYIYDEKKSGKHNIKESWGKVPFIKLANNVEEMSDLDQVKSLIDAFDLNMSDFTNNLADLQDIVYILKNYEGESLQDFIHNLKNQKAIKIGDDGGVDTLDAEIPFEARMAHLKEIKENIFVNGQGVDVAIDKLQNPSGAALKFIYSLLDLKCDGFEIQVRKALRKFLWFYFKAKGQELKTSNIKVTFNRNMIVNEGEMLDNSIKSLQLNSKETALEHNPFVDNVETELKKINEENGVKVIEETE